MEVVKRYFSDRTAGFWLIFAASVAAIAGAIVYIAVYAALSTPALAERNFSAVSFAFMLAGGVTGLAACLFDIGLLSLIPVALFSVATGMHVYTSIPSITDLITGVNFYMGTQEYAIAFIVIFAVISIAAVISCFLPARAAKR